VPKQRERLNRVVIARVASEMIADSGTEKFSLRALAKRLGVDPAAIYRHYADLEELLRAVGDLGLAPAVARFSTSDDPSNDARRLLLRLRRALLSSGTAAQFTMVGPTRLENELQITEILLDALQRGGCSTDEAVLAYHCLIEFTVGSAALDAPLSSAKAVRQETYRRWRSDYLALDPTEYPAIRAHAKRLYPSSDAVFEIGLDALLAQFLR
jgi:AcrR family transcriptional regulator